MPEERESPMEASKMGRGSLVPQFFHRFDYLLEFLRRLKKHFADAIMGATVTGIAIAVVALVTSLPHWIWAMVLMGAFFFAAYAAWREEYLKNSTRDKEADTRDQLGVFILEGQALLVRCSKENEPPPGEEVNEWAQQVETFLGQTLARSYIARFRNGAGLPMAANFINSIPHRNLWAAVRLRLARLEQFSQEYGR
jgi:hypothetical protein